jgi:hypothetical protein
LIDNTREADGYKFIPLDAAGRGGAFVAKQTVETGNLKIELEDLIINAELIITDMVTGHIVTLRSENISKAPGRITARAILKEFLHHI